MDFFKKLSELPEDEISKIKTELEALKAKTETIQSTTTSKLWPQLQDSEQLVWDLYLHYAKGNPAPAYGTCNDAAPEFGPMLYIGPLKRFLHF